MERVLAFECKYGVIKYRKPTVSEGYALSEQYCDIPSEFAKFKDIDENDTIANKDKLKLITSMTRRLYGTLVEHKFIVSCDLKIDDEIVDKVEQIENYIELKDELSALCFSFIGLVFGIDLKKNT